MKISITTKLILLITLLVSMTAITISSYLYNNSAEILVQNALQKLTHNVDFEGERIRTRIAELKNNLRFLAASPPVQGLIRAKQNNKGYDTRDSSTAAQWKTRLSSIFQTLTHNIPDIYQIRLIDHNGTEQVKIERDAQGNMAAVKNELLQNKAQTNYIKQAMKLKSNEIYLSSISLNREFNKITLPHTLVLRAVIPIYSQPQKLFGFIVINLDFGRYLKQIEKSYLNRNETLYVMNQDGSYLIHPKSEKRYSLDLGYGYRIQEDFPRLADLFAPGNKAKDRTLLPEEGNDKLLVFVKLYFDTSNLQRFLAIGLTQNYSDVIAAETVILKNNSWVVLLLILTGILLAIGFGGLLTTPLRQIVTGIDRLLKEPGYQLPAQTNDEIGKLATTLNQMALEVHKSEQELQNMNLRLEEQVEERTHELHVNLRMVNTISNAQTTFIGEKNAHHAFDIILSGLLEASESEYGFIAEVDHDDDGAPFLRSTAMTNIAWDEETRKLYEKYSAGGMEFRNLDTLFGKVIRNQKPVISNDPATDPRAGGLPRGHPPLHRFFGIPIFSASKMVGVIGLANRSNEYSEDMLPRLAPFTATCAHMLGSIHARKQADATDRELQQARIDLEQAIQSSAAVFYTARATGDFGATFISQNIRQQLGYEPNDFLSTPTFWADNIHPDDRERVFAGLESLFEHDEHTHEYRFLNKDGHYRWMHDSVKLKRDKNGEPLELSGFWTDITERKQAELELRQREREISTILENLPLMLFIKDAEELRFTRFNRAGEKLLGLPRETFIGKNDYDFFPRQQADFFTAKDREVIENGFTVDIPEETISTQTGDRILHTRKTVIPDENGKPIYLVGLSEDITERKQIEQALEESEEKFRSVISSSPMGIFVYELQDDNRLIFTDYNPASSEILGIDCSQFIGLSLEHAFPNLIDTEIPEAYRRAARDGLPWHSDDVYYDDQQNITGAFDVYAFQTSQNKMAVMFMDITQRRKAQEELMRFKTTLDLTKDSVLMFSPETLTLFYVNQGALLQTHFTEQELINQPIYNLLPEYNSNQLRSLIVALSAEENNKSLILETQLMNKEGELSDIELHLQYIQPIDEAARGVAIMRDITERKKIDRMKNEFVSTVSHELRTPLTSIRGSLGLLKGGAVGKLNKKAQAMIDIANSNTDRLLLLINDILDIQKIESGELSFQFKPVKVMSLIDKVIKENKSFADQYQVSLSITHHLENMHILADEDRMVQVLNNLISNAVKFSSPGDSVELAATQHGETIRISVTDYGPGIPESFHDKLFDRFTQSDASDSKQKGGTGLGLSIVKTIIEKHNGIIDFTTEPGVGTSMYVELACINPAKTVNKSKKSNS